MTEMINAAIASHLSLSSAASKTVVTFALLVVAVISSTPSTSNAQAKAQTKAASKTTFKTKSSSTVSSAAKKLPAKNVKKRTFLDFTESRDGDAVIFKSLSPVSKALIKSDRDLEAAGQVTEVRSRSIVPAPQGDLAEPLSTLSGVPTTRPSPRPTVSATRPPAPQPTPAPLAEPIIAPPPTRPVAPNPGPEPTPAAGAEPNPELVVEKPSNLIPTDSPSENDIAEPSSKVTAETAHALNVGATVGPVVSEPISKSSFERTTVFFRTGYLSANYRKFDDRMSDGATSFGFAASREFRTSLGELEGRTAVDVFHATDQSISVANVRTISLRADVTRWLTTTRVKPGVSLGAGWSESSIRSYRSRSDQTAPPGDVIVRTHAEGQSFSLIPSATLRVELSKHFKVDFQAEYLAQFGNDAAEASRGAAVTVSLGWTK